MNKFAKVAVTSGLIGAVAYVKSDKRTKKKIRKDSKSFLRIANDTMNLF